MQYIIMLLIVIGLAIARCAAKDVARCCVLSLDEGRQKIEIVNYNMELKEEYHSILNTIIGGE